MSTGEAWPARLIESKPMEEGDVALLKVEQSNLPVVELASSEDVAIGTPILSIGYPGTSDLVVDATLEPTFKDGKISSSKTREGGLIPVYEISAAVSGGMSGGPTVDLDGRVVGINSFGINSQIETQQFNFVSPSTLLSEMLARNGVVNELGPVGTLYREGLDLFYAGSYAAAIETFDEVLDRVPSHQQAQEFRVRAANAGPDTAPEEPEAVADEPAADSSGGGISPLVLVGGLVALLVIGGLAFVVARSRGRSKKDAPPQSPSAPMEPVATPQAAPEHPAAGNGAPAPVGAPEPQPVSAGVNGEPAPVTERQPLGFAAPSPEQSARRPWPRPRRCSACTAALRGHRVRRSARSAANPWQGRWPPRSDTGGQTKRARQPPGPLCRMMVPVVGSATTPPSNAGRLMLLDAPSLYFRAFFGVPLTTRAADGRPVNALKGLLEFIAHLLTARRAHALAAAADPESGMAAELRRKLMAARGYLTVADPVVRVVTDVPVPRVDDRLPAVPASPAALVALAEGLGLDATFNRVLAAMARHAQTDATPSP